MRYLFFIKKWLDDAGHHPTCEGLVLMRFSVCVCMGTGVLCQGILQDGNRCSGISGLEFLLNGLGRVMISMGAAIIVLMGSGIRTTATTSTEEHNTANNCGRKNLFHVIFFNGEHRCKTGVRFKG
jgi:hypothetical protein